MKDLITNRRRQFVFVAFTAFAFLFAAQGAVLAQRKFQPDDVIPVGGGWAYKIVECRAKPNTHLEECDYTSVHEDGSTREARTFSVVELRRYVQQYEAEKKRLASDPRSRPKNQKPPVEVIMPPSEIPSEAVEITVTAQQLYKEYGNNDIAATRKYVGKTVRVTGAFVYSISSSVFSVRITKTFLGSTIQCYVEDPEQLATLNKDEVVTIVGVPLGSQTSTGVVFEPCRVERKNTAQATKPETAKPPVKTAGTANGKIVGTWYYTAIINADGTEKKLSNRESYLWLKEDGSYEHRFGNFGQTGTFAGSGSRLTLNREDGDKKSYTMTIAGTAMTLKNASGGYKLERE